MHEGEEDRKKEGQKANNCARPKCAYSAEQGSN